MASLLIVILTSLLLYMLSKFLSGYRTYNEAKKIGLPVLFTPIGNRSTIWLLIENYLTPVIQRIPFSIGKWLQRTKPGWTLRTQRHEELGPVFVVAGAGGNKIIVVADPLAAEDIFHRRKDFTKSGRVYSQMNIFGSSVLSTNGEDWQRHRRITTPPFNERNSNLVWRESLFQYVLFS